MKITRIFPVLLVAIILTSCAGIESPIRESRTDAEKFFVDDNNTNVEVKKSPLKAFVLADIQAALAIAREGEDRMAIMCWETLADIVAKDKTGVKVKGVLSAFQKARNRRRKVQSGVDEELQISCAPMAVGSGTAVLRLIRKLTIGF